MWIRRQSGLPGPWTDDPILQRYRFTNAYRVLDRVSQYLVSEVAYAGSQAISDVVLRTVLFKIFNKTTTWEALCSEFGRPSAHNFDPKTYGDFLSDVRASGRRIYSNAYIVPPLRSLPRPKHAGHLQLIAMMLEDGFPGRVAAAESLGEMYDLLRGYEGLGDFLAFQLSIDLGYTSVTSVDEGDFVVAGPGALDGLKKCFPDMSRKIAADLIHAVCDQQEEWFQRLDLAFTPLAGRRLQPVDCQNLFCEISKYSRVAFPDVKGSNNRTHIKQTYRTAGPLPGVMLPPKWLEGAAAETTQLPRQGLVHESLALANVSTSPRAFDASDEAGWVASGSS
jgi:hypothetical protein